MLINVVDVTIHTYATKVDQLVNLVDEPKWRRALKGFRRCASITDLCTSQIYCSPFGSASPTLAGFITVERASNRCASITDLCTSQLYCSPFGSASPTLAGFITVVGHTSQFLFLLVSCGISRIRWLEAGKSRRMLVTKNKFIILNA